MDRASETFGTMLPMARGSTLSGGDRAKKTASAMFFVRPPVAGNAETLRMIAPGPDDRNREVWWTLE